MTACSSKPTQVTDTSENNPSSGPVYDTEKPISFAEYKEWRKTNDPAGSAYAAFKEWEIAYKRWKAEQEN